MWYLQIRSLAVLAAAVAAMMAFIRLCSGRRWFDAAFSLALPVVSLAGVFIISAPVGLFYCAYLLFSYALVLLLGRVVRGRPPDKPSAGRSGSSVDAEVSVQADTAGVRENVRRAGILRKALFAVSVILCFAPLIAVRLVYILFGFDFSWLTIGIAFNMLKAADVLFYTYYTHDRVKILTYAGFLLFLPTLTAGPVIRFRDFIRAKALPMNAEDSVVCVKRVIRGMFKKIVAAAFLMLALNRLLELPAGVLASLGIIASSYFILFFDLSGYSDVAIAFGRAFGLKVAENFKNPFKAPSLTLFWRNWHVSLSDWIREHVFVLFSGKRLGRFQSAALALLTMVFMAMWHGFSVPVLIGGVYNGLFLFGESLFGWTGFKRNGSKAAFALRCVLTNFFFAVNTLLFTVDLRQMTGVLRGLAGL